MVQGQSGPEFTPPSVMRDTVCCTMISFRSCAVHHTCVVLPICPGTGTPQSGAETDAISVPSYHICKTPSCAPAADCVTYLYVVRCHCPCPWYAQGPRTCSA